MNGLGNSWAVGVCVAIMFSATLGLPSANGADSDPGVQDVLGQLDSLKGICALIGDTNAELAIDLVEASQLVAYVQLNDAKVVNAALCPMHRSGREGLYFEAFQGTRSDMSREPHSRIATTAPSGAGPAPALGLAAELGLLLLIDP